MLDLARYPVTLFPNLDVEFRLFLGGIVHNFELDILRICRLLNCDGSTTSIIPFTWPLAGKKGHQFMFARCKVTYI